MTIATGYKDHTGRMIHNEDRCFMDAGHAHCDDWLGTIVKQKDYSFQFVADGEPIDGGCPLQDCHLSLEVIVS